MKLAIMPVTLSAMHREQYKHIDNLLQEAKILYRGSDINAIRQFHARVGKRYPTAAGLWNKLSIVASNAKRFNLAVCLAEAALKIAPENPAIIINMASHLMHVQEEEKGSFEF